MPNLFKKPKDEANKSRNFHNRYIMTPRTIKTYKPSYIIARVMSESSELGQMSKKNSIPSPQVQRKQNNYQSNQLIKFQEEMLNNKNNKVAVYLTKTKPLFYLPKVDLSKSTV